MRLPSCVLHICRNDHAVSLCVSELNGRMLCTEAGESGRWDGDLTAAEEAEALWMLEQDRRRPEVGESVVGRLVAAEAMMWTCEEAA